MNSSNETSSANKFSSYARMTASIAALAMAHLIALYLFGYLSIYVVPARNTSFVWWLCYLFVGGFRTVLSCPLILPALALKLSMVPIPLVITNSIVWGLGLHRFISWCRNSRKLTTSGLSSQQAG